LTAIITVIVHGFFIFRIYGLSRGNWFVVGPILILALIRLGLASTTCAKMLIYADFELFVQSVAWVFTMGLVTSSVLDVVTTLCLVWYLGRAKTGFAGMDQIVNTLSLYAVENGLLTSVAIVASLGCWLGMRGNLVFMAIHFVVAKLYANSLLATLNSRKRIRGRTRAASSDINQPMTVFNLGRAATLKRSTDHIGVRNSDEEKGSIRHDEETGIALSPMKWQPSREGDSMETATTSNTKTVVESLTIR